jgi:hypothetical protein
LFETHYQDEVHDTEVELHIILLEVGKVRILLCLLLLMLLLLLLLQELVLHHGVLLLEGGPLLRTSKVLVLGLGRSVAMEAIHLVWVDAPVLDHVVPAMSALVIGPHRPHELTHLRPIHPSSATLTIVDSHSLCQLLVLHADRGARKA